MKEKSKNEIIQRYRDRISKFGVTFDSLGSGTKSRQLIRFDIQKNVGIKSGDRILDVGCGLGDFYNYLKKQKIDVDYYGVDLVPELIEEAKNQNPECTFEVRDILDNKFTKNSFDFVVCSQVMNLKFSDDDNNKHLKRMLENMFNYSSKGVACDFLSKFVDFQEDHLNYYDPSFVFNLAKSLTKRADLIHSYPLFEFTIYLYPDFEGWNKN